MLKNLNLSKSRKIKQIGEFDIVHLEDTSRMIIYKELYDDGLKWITKFENEEIELIDYYCKNDDCACTDVFFGIEQNTEEIGGFWYDYNLGETKKFSDPKFKLIFQEFSHEEKKVISALLANRHKIVKNEFKKFKLETELSLQKKAINKKKVGRNEPCPCGSGLKYKKCCLL